MAIQLLSNKMMRKPTGMHNGRCLSNDAYNNLDNFQIDMNIPNIDIP
jgi:hypothetical protein